MFKDILDLVLVLLAICALPIAAYENGTHIGYVKGCINGINKTLKGFSDAGVEFRAQDTPKQFCEEQYREK